MLRSTVAGVAAIVASLLLLVVVLGGDVALRQAVGATCQVSAGADATLPIEAGQTAHVRTIIGVAKGRGVPARGWLVALAVALQESGIRNLANPAHPDSLTMTTEGQGTDHDSLGIFQQRPQAGWGTVRQLMAPLYQATAFFGGPDVPPANPGLLDVDGWESLPVTVAAQRVQRSAYPSAYAKWEDEAVQLAAANADAPRIPVGDRAAGAAAGGPVTVGADGLCGLGGILPVRGATGDAAAVIAAARRWLGTPYSWGGGTLEGPGPGICCSPGGYDARGTVGFDCSSYTRYAFYHGAGITLPRTSAEQYAATAARTVVLADPDPVLLQPGDLLFWGTSAGSIHHVALYAGAGLMLEEPRTGLSAQLVPVYDGDFYAATRPLATVALAA
jgi:cell wall-associated NlpC family hydrolase